MRGLRLPRSRSAHRPSRPSRYVVSLLAALALSCRTGRRVGRERLHRASCLRPLVDPVPVPGWLHGRRRPPDRGDRQLHRGGDDA